MEVMIVTVLIGPYLVSVLEAGQLVKVRVVVTSTVVPVVLHRTIAAIQCGLCHAVMPQTKPHAKHLRVNGVARLRVWQLDTGIRHGAVPMKLLLAQLWVVLSVVKLILLVPWQ